MNIEIIHVAIELIDLLKPILTSIKRAEDNDTHLARLLNKELDKLYLTRDALTAHLAKLEREALEKYNALSSKEN